MRVAWIQLGGAASAAVLALLMSAPVRAADNTVGMTAVAAEELDERSKQAQGTQGKSKGMSDSAVRVLMTYAFSIIPEQTSGPEGKVKVDKSDPNKFFLPNDDARRVIRAATRSAYAEVCDLIELGRANYQALIKGEEARKTWSQEQLMMVGALHLFAVSYFTGNARITDEPEEAPAPAAADGTATAAKSAGEAQSADQSAQSDVVVAPPRPKCPPEQKQKVMNAINAYVKAAQVAPPKQ